MSKTVNEIVGSIYEKPYEWKPCTYFDDSTGDYCGIKKGNIRIYGMGNSKLLSVIDLEINGLTYPSSYFDTWNLEKVCLWWYKTAPSSAFIKEARNTIQFVKDRMKTI